MKQMIPTHTLTRLVDRPELTVYHDFGRNAWAEVQEDGFLRVEVSMATSWTVYQDSDLPAIHPER